MKQLAVLAFLLSACAAPVAVTSFAPPTIEPFDEKPVPVNAATAILPTPTVEPQPQRTNWLLLGGDYRAHREGTGWGNRTDVIVLVSVLETDPMQITIVQFPRNLYTPFSGGDVWLFAVWDEFGWQGLHQYFQEVFGVNLQGIHYVNMDSFVSIVDGLSLGGIDGIPVASETSPGRSVKFMGGEEVLAFLRDNENNWELGSYDKGQRVFRVLLGIWTHAQYYFLSDPIAAVNVLYGEWGDLVETDLSNIKQLYWLFTLGWRVRNAEIEWGWVQLKEPIIIRGDTPIMQNEQPTRGMIAATDLSEWMRETLNE